MLEINAKENSIVEVVEGSFPLGQRNTIKVNILDEEIKDRVQLQQTGICNSSDNDFFSYGEFNNDNDIDHLVITGDNNIVELIDGEGINYSRCLHCNFTEDGKIEFPTDKQNMVYGNHYVFSCYIKVTSGSIKLEDTFFSETSNITDDWVFIRKDIDVTEDKYSPITLTPTSFPCECYIDNLSLFDASNEILTTDPENRLDVKIEILEPYVPTKNVIDKLITWSKTDDNVSVYLYVDPINVVDFGDNILCKLLINQNIQPITEYLGDYTYHNIPEIIYESNKFVLDGYIMPLDSILPTVDETTKGKYLTNDGKVVEWKEVSALFVDQIYNPTSTNAQSGVAVAQAISDVKQYVDFSIQNTENKLNWVYLNNQNL
nr:hypothetical protein DGKKSRWO_DGKKSRWO_CDS_0182 [uncultured phage]CAI9752360.1 hypothetical protein CVNMHQAP_CVNMHQAP_CDS_0183 [uncultured phage]